MPQFDPLRYPHALTEMRYFSAHSAWSGHLPFTQAIVPMTRPHTLVELGTHWGDSYCGFCQAVATHALPTRCFAVDTWRGDAHTGAYGDAAYNHLRAHHDANYAAFSTLLRATFDEAVARFDDGSIDLLHVDGLHTYDAVRHDFDTWLPKVSDRGVVLMHDTAARHGDFGVWRLWAELKDRYPSFELPHESGLGILAVGRAAPPELLAFLETARREEPLVRGYFKAIGDRYTLAAILTRVSGMMQFMHATTDQWRARVGRPAPPPPQPAHDVMALAHAVLADVKELAGRS